MRTNGKEFLAAVRTAARGCPKHKASMPVLNMVRIRWEDGIGTVQGTNLESSVDARFDAVGSDLDVCIDPRDLTCLGLSSDDVTIEEAGTVGVNISQRPLEAYLPVVPGEEFPTYKVPDCDEVEMSAQDLTDLYALTEFCSTDYRWTPLCGVCINGNEAAATDRRRLGCVTLQASLPGSVVIPIDTVKLLKQALPRSAESVYVRVCPDALLISFHAESVLVVSRLVEGQFPDYHKVIPADTDIASVMIVNTSEFLGALNRVRSVAATDEHRAHLLPDGQTLRLASQGSERSVSFEIPMRSEGSKLFETAFSVRYLASGAKFAANGEFRLGQVTEMDQAMAKCGNRTFVVMPMVRSLANTEESLSRSNREQ